MIVMENNLINVNPKITIFKKRYDKIKEDEILDEAHWYKLAELKKDLAEFWRQKGLIPKLSKKSIITICQLESHLQFMDYHRFLYKF